MFGQQIGQAVGVLAGEVVGSTDIGLPLGPAGKAALLPAEHRRRSARTWACRRTRCGCTWRCARRPTSGSSPTCRGCARTCSARSRATPAGIKVDTAKLEDVVGQLDPTHPEQLQEALQQGMFQPEDTPEQKAALARLETALALVEGWVDAVVHAAAEPQLPSADALRETLRRRRATGGPAEQTFATLIGLELRPRRLRDAARLWAVAHRRAGRGRPRRAVGAPGHAADGRPTWTTRTASCTASSWTSPSWTRCSARPRAAGRRSSDKDTDDRQGRRGAARTTTGDKGDRTTATSEPARRRAGPRTEAALRATRRSCGRLYLDHLAAHPDGMWKACGAGHVTASALVIDPARGRVLLTLHRKLRHVAADGRPLRAGGRHAGGRGAARGHRGVRDRAG